MENFLHLEDDLMVIKGATKIVSSTANQSIVEIGEKSVVITGKDIEVKKLNLEEKEVALSGIFFQIKFCQTHSEKTSLFKKIFK